MVKMRWEKIAEQYATFYPFAVAKRVFERDYVKSLLLYTGGNVSAAARIADKDRKDFYALMERANVNPEDYR